MKNRVKSNKNIKFIEVTQQLLNNNNYPDVIKWDDEGKRIQIIDRQLLQSVVLPKYFKHANYSSFLRQLNMYGFTSCKDTNGILTYYHPCFTQKRTIMKQIKKRKQLLTHKTTQNTDYDELKKNILSLKSEQNKIQSNLLSSINCSIKIQSSISNILSFKKDLAKEGEHFCRVTIDAIKLLVSSMVPEICKKQIKLEIYYQHLFRSLFADSIEDQSFNVGNDEMMNKLQLSPIPFGQIGDRVTLMDLSPFMNMDDSNLDYGGFGFQI